MTSVRHGGQPGVGGVDGAVPSTATPLGSLRPMNGRTICDKGSEVTGRGLNGIVKLFENDCGAVDMSRFAGEM
jgi:hypothetical protein